MEAVDRLPHRPKWEHQQLSLKDGTGTEREVVTLYKRNIVEVVEDLIGNPRFANNMRYAPERQWTSSAKETRIYSEMWTGNWWWRTQVSICDNRMTQY
jgi:hypothetical protein